MTLNQSRWGIPALASILYFSQGFPFGIVNEGVNLYLSFSKVDLGTIGLVGSVGLIWTLKFLWAPLVDALATYRIWISGALIVLALTIAALGQVPRDFGFRMDPGLHSPVEFREESVAVRNRTVALPAPDQGRGGADEGQGVR